MSCQNQEIANRLSDYVTGHLNDREAESVREHLSTCKTCQQTLELMKLMRVESTQTAPEVETPHIPADTLVAFDRDPDALDEGVRQTVREHVESCEQCASALEFVSGFDDELAAASTVVGQSTPIPVRTTMRHVVTVMAIAAVLVLVIAGLDRFAPGPTDASIVWELREMTRAGGEVPELVIGTSASEQTVLIPHYHQVSRYSYAVRLFKDAQAELDIHPTEFEFSEAGRLLCRLQFAAPISGDYELHLLEVSRTTPPDTTVKMFPFRMTIR